ncbi:hypothetical protein CPAV1605_1459 [seawater metagenome]|uniref:Uncharacterized protein n=1 Tax=seawater metagenome TaxID=1561972 RepID=A0A5E8CLB6_9ZZZZ
MNCKLYETLLKMQNDIAEMKKDIKEIKEDVKDIKNSNKNMDQHINFINSVYDKYNNSSIFNLGFFRNSCDNDNDKKK